LADAEGFGWSVPERSFSWENFQTKLQTELNRLEEVYRKMLKASDVDIFDSHATLTDAHTVKFGNNATKTARHILIATGGSPVRPPLPNAGLGIVSDDIFDFDTLPRSILIVGGGYIGCEFACILNGLGVEVTQINRKGGILRGFDEEATGLISEQMRARGVDQHFGTTIVEMTAAHEHEDMPKGTASDAAAGADSASAPADLQPGSVPVWVKMSNGQEKIFDKVLFATGRAPNTEGLGLEEVGVKLGRRGEIEVDDYSKTSVPSIYAIGDVTDRVQLTPVAIREGMAFVETVFNDNPTKPDHETIPSAVFSQPELGTVGLTEEQAMERGPVEIYCTSFKPMQQAFAGRSDRVLMKLVVDAESRVVLGCHIVADHAGEMIQLAGIAVKLGATKEQFDQTCAVHPTIAEELVTMKEPVRSA
ncbi:MAG: FAD-dependent oxidoreductase, partial [Marivita sp.]|uniref:FAD-dependent oxidoreductase n=1 Tax=Marivita sp. TaxID=2003365 RepID=UPI003EF0B706